MESQEFIVLYTHQKMKRSKVWQDGILKVTHLGNKAILYDDKGECLESLFLKHLEVKPGDGLEGDRYLITVEEARAAGSMAVNQEAIQEAPGYKPRQAMPSGRSPRYQPPGLKRKYAGFQGPCQVPKKMVIVENGESAVSLEAVTPGPAFLSPFLSTPPLFSAAAKKEVNRMPAEPKNIVVYEDTGKNGPPLSYIGSALSSRNNPEVLWEERHLGSPVSSADKHAISLLTDEPTKGHSLDPHCSGVAQNIRSKAQILALLKSKSTSMSKEVDSEMLGHVLHVQPQGSLQVPPKPQCLIECAERRTESLQSQQPPESTLRSTSRWAMYLSLQSSPVHSAVDGNNLDRKPKVQGDDINLNQRDILIQKRIQLFETGAENGEKCNENKLVDTTDSPWDQEEKLEIPLFCESNSLPVTCGNVENDGLVSESNIQENTPIPVNQNDQLCIKGSIPIRENAQEINTCGTAEKGYKRTVAYLPESECLQIEPSLSNNSKINDAITDMFSRTKTDNESLSICGPLSSVTQPVLEVNFNLNNFETSDTEEESQESNKMPQDQVDWEKETLADDHCSGVQGMHCEEGSGAPLPLSVPIGGKPTEMFLTMETVPSQLCGQAGPAGGEMAECTDSAFEWTGDVYTGNGAADTPIQKVRCSYDFASVPNKCKGINSNLHSPHFLNIDTNQTPESNLFSEQTEHQSFIMRSDLDTNDEQVLPWSSGSDNSIQLLNDSQNHSDECIALDKSNTQVSNSLFYPLGRKHPISKDTEAHIPESEDLGRISSLSHDHVEVDTAGASRQYWSSPRNSSEPSGLVNSISLLKSLSEHSTALESLEMLKKKNTSFKQQGMLQTHEPENSPEAGKPLIPVVSRAVPQSPRLNQDSHLCSTPMLMKENEVESVESLQSSQFFALGGEEGTVFPAVTPKQTERNIWGPQVTSPAQEGLASTPVSLFPLDSRDEDFVLEFSEESLKAQTLPDTHNFLEPGRCLVSREVTPGDLSLLNQISAQSKWLKYQNTPQGDLMAPHSLDMSVTDGFFAKAVPRMCFSDTAERHSDAGRDRALDSVCLQVVRGVLHQEQQGVSLQDFVCRKKALSLRFKPTSKAEDVQNVLGEPACSSCSISGLQEINVSELCFPSGQKIKSVLLPRRRTHIPAVFQSPAHYKQVFTACLTEHLNILLFGLAQRLHKALSTVDISFYMSFKGEKRRTVENNVPSCHHRQPAKLVMVKKEGPNKGRLFYTCDAPKPERCKFFKWLEEVAPGHLTQEDSPPAMVLSDIKSIGLYLRSQKIPLYEECQLLVRKRFDFHRKQYGKLKKFMTVNPEFCNEPKSKLYLKLSRKESSSTYSKDDLWVVSKTLDFELDTFIACSAFFGPSAVNEVELLPLKGYFPSNWPRDTVVHALRVCNASMELTALRNMQDHFNPATLPLTPHLLAMPSSTTVSNKSVGNRKFIPPAFSKTSTHCDLPSLEAALQLAGKLIQAHKLNKGQAAALAQIAQMVASQGRAEGVKELSPCPLPITTIHGVFGAGKSYLLAVVILFFVQLFEESEAPTAGNARPWKVLVSSSTNVAVDRVLLGLLSLGFEKFVRVGSVRKIAKPVLPYSLHAGSESANEQLKELHALMKEDLTPAERVYVRRSIERHKLGTNRTLLGQVRVVGATCAACPFPCMDDLKFPVVVLDECSQITEPASLLPIARFECEKLILVGDPKQLPPTLQGSDAAHENGLEQTLFDRLCLMAGILGVVSGEGPIEYSSAFQGHKPVLLRTQYRCHPAITAVANDLFYGGSLRDGVSEAERGPLLNWLPTLCFYNVQGREQMEGGNSFHNEAEAAFTLTLIRSLVASGVAGSMIGVITLYRAQLVKLCHLLGAVDSDRPSLRAVQVSTVDAFQGAEKEVIVLSCVRTRQVGFIDSEKRMNVALTRGKRHLLIVGNLACLRKNRLWGRVIQHCEGREDGLQHASQCEPRLHQLLEDHLGKQAEGKQTKEWERQM